MTTSGDDSAPPPGPPDPPDPPDLPEPPDPPGPAVAPPPPPGRQRGLARSTDRYVGGVAGGLADVLDVDPIVVRLGLVVATLYLPVVAVGYALAWLLLPDERSGATLLGAARRPEGWRPVAGVAGLGLGVALLAPDLGPGGDGVLTFGVVLAGIGLLLVLRHPGDADASASPPPPVLGSGHLATERDPEPRIPEPVPPLERLVRRRFDQVRRQRPPSHLGWSGLSALVVLAGVLAAVDRGIEPVKPGVAVSIGLLLVGAVLLLAAWRGRARLLILPGLALLPLWVGFGLSDVPRYEHDGDVHYTAGSRDELRHSYEHGYGQMEIDIADTALRAGEHRALLIGLTAGNVRLDVPPAAHLEIHGHIGAGAVEVSEHPYFGVVAESGGVGRDVDLRVGDPRPICTEQSIFVGPPTTDELGNAGPEDQMETQMLTPWGERCEPDPPVDDPPVLELTLDVGIGTVEVHRATA